MAYAQSTTSHLADERPSPSDRTASPQAEATKTAEPSWQAQVEARWDQVKQSWIAGWEDTKAWFKALPDNARSTRDEFAAWWASTTWSAKFSDTWQNVQNLGSWINRKVIQPSAEAIRTLMDGATMAWGLYMAASLYTVMSVDMAAMMAGGAAALSPAMFTPGAPVIAAILLISSGYAYWKHNKRAETKVTEQENVALKDRVKTLEAVAGSLLLFTNLEPEVTLQQTPSDSKSSLLLTSEPNAGLLSAYDNFASTDRHVQASVTPRPAPTPSKKDKATLQM